MRRRDPYDVLDLSPLATLDEARAAFRRLAAIFHPDRFADARDDVRAEAAKQMGYVNEAWRQLEGRLRADDLADRAGRAVAADDAPVSTSGRDGRQWQDAGDAFSSRARHARTKQRVWQKTSAAAEQREEQRRRAEETQRAEFVRQARERLAEEEAARSRADAGPSDPA